MTVVRRQWSGVGKRIACFVFGTAFFALGSSVDAQPKKIPKVGVLVADSALSSEDRVEAFRQGLRDLGYVEGQNIAIEYRFAEGVNNRLPNLAAELVRLNVDVLFAFGTAATQAAKNATQTTPIVMTNVTDPVSTGLIVSLARPGGISRDCPTFSKTSVENS